MKNKTLSYHEQVNRENVIKLRNIISKLPKFAARFFRGIEEYTSSRTRIAYAYDLRVFFEFIKTNTNYYDCEIIDYPIDILNCITRDDIEEFLQYLSLYDKDDQTHSNEERGKMRKLATIRSFYKYYFQNEEIEKNTAELIPMPKLHEKAIIRLDADEVADLLDLVENGEGASKSENRYLKKTRIRDLAILTLLLGTGIRVSECVGLNLQDIDEKNHAIKVYRKGGYEAFVYYGEEVAEALSDYLEKRAMIMPQEGHEDALFLSLQNRRITVRAVENMVKKYASRITTLKHITPHKLRSTYGTALYRETGDIYLVADVLGHKDVNTTRKHYAAQDEDRRRRAASAVTLRGSDDK